MRGWSPKANEVGEGLFCRTWKAWKQSILDTAVIFNYEHSLVTTLGKNITKNRETRYFSYTSYYLEHCIESYQYGITYHLQFRKDAIYSLRKLRLALLGNRLKDLRQYKTDIRWCQSYTDLFFWFWAFTTQE